MNKKTPYIFSTFWWPCWKDFLSSSLTSSTQPLCLLLNSYRLKLALMLLTHTLLLVLHHTLREHFASCFSDAFRLDYATDLSKSCSLRAICMRLCGDSTNPIGAALNQSAARRLKHIMQNSKATSGVAGLSEWCGFFFYPVIPISLCRRRKALLPL